MRRSRDVVLPSGGRLAASLELPEPEPRGAAAVLLCHGFTGHRVEDGRLFVRLARRLAADGIVSLRFDFRGSGDSDGEPDAITIEHELEDARAALEALCGEAAVDRGRCAVLGLSLGSSVAMLLAGERPELAGLVLWAPLTEPGLVFDPAAGDEPRPGWRLQSAFFESCAKARPLEGLARYAGPVLCVRGSRDYLPARWAEQARAASRHPASALETVDGEHTFGSDQGKTRAVELTRAWLVRVLGRASTTP